VEQQLGGNAPGRVVRSPPAGECGGQLGLGWDGVRVRVRVRVGVKVRVRVRVRVGARVKVRGYG